MHILTFGRHIASSISRGSAPATRERVYARTLELALGEGRAAHEIIKCDYDQAMREVTGESDRDRQDEILDRLCKKPGRSGRRLKLVKWKKEAA